MDFNIKTLRESNKLTQNALAERLGVNIRTLQNYERTGELPLYMQKLIWHEFYRTGSAKSFSKEKAVLKQKINYLQKLIKTHEERIKELELEIASK